MYRVYQVNSNDTLESIAKKLNTTSEVLKELNGIKNDMILMPGSFIIIPNVDDRFSKYIVRPGDSIYKIASEKNIDPSLLLKLNGLNEYDYIYPNQELLIPTDNYKFYITKTGDTIKSVMDNLNITYDNLLNNNEVFLLEDQLIIYK